MKHEGMARAMSELDDDLIASACQYRAKPHKTYFFPRMLAAAACLVLIATAALVMHRTPETDIYIDGTALSADPVPIDQPMPMALDGRSTDVQTLCLSLSFESRTDAPLEVSVSEGILDSTADSSPRALSARTVSAGEILLWTVDPPTRARSTPSILTAKPPPCCAATAPTATGSPSGPEATKQHIQHYFGGKFP